MMVECSYYVEVLEIVKVIVEKVFVDFVLKSGCYIGLVVLEV